MSSCSSRPFRCHAGWQLTSGFLAHEDRGPGNQRTTQGTPSAPDLLVLVRPLRLDQIDEAEPGGRDLTHPVAQGAVMFDVGRRARLLLDIWGPVEIGAGHGEPRMAGVIGQRPPDLSLIHISE